MSVIQINCAGPAVAPFVADEYFSPSSTIEVDRVDTSHATNPAPQAVYFTQRYGNNFTYTIPGLAASTQYLIRLHFNEIWASHVGQRTFNVFINGSQVLGAFDVYATVGQNVAIVKEFLATSDPSGVFSIQFTWSSQNAIINGIEILPPPAPTTTTLTSSVNPALVGQTITYTATVAPTSGSGVPTGTVTFYDGTTVIGTGVLS